MLCVSNPSASTHDEKPAYMKPTFSEQLRHASKRPVASTTQVTAEALPTTTTAHTASSRDDLVIDQFGSHATDMTSTAPGAPALPRSSSSGLAPPAADISSQVRAAIHSPRIDAAAGSAMNAAQGSLIQRIIDEGHALTETRNKLLLEQLSKLLTVKNSAMLDLLQELQKEAVAAAVAGILAAQPKRAVSVRPAKVAAAEAHAVAPDAATIAVDTTAVDAAALRRKAKRIAKATADKAALLAPPTAVKVSSEPSKVKTADKKKRKAAAVVVIVTPAVSPAASEAESDADEPIAPLKAAKVAAKVAHKPTKVAPAAPSKTSGESATKKQRRAPVPVSDSSDSGSDINSSDADSDADNFDVTTPHVVAMARKTDVKKAATRAPAVSAKASIPTTTTTNTTTTTTLAIASAVPVSAAKAAEIKAAAKAKAEVKARAVASVLKAKANEVEKRTKAELARNKALAASAALVTEATAHTSDDDDDEASADEAASADDASDNASDNGHDSE